ncbi:cytochrome P450 [Fictibacillus phosphorivorans]|uniref:cytochrome P450 n=1 Tax=Fictibacillus phosphorivorans TaxID=1221500 RepID=UPI003CEA30B4
MNDIWSTYLKTPKSITDLNNRYEPFKWYEFMREAKPLVYDLERKTWDVFLYDDVKYILEDRQNFALHRIDQGGKKADVKKHIQMRSLINKAFTPKAMNSWVEKIKLYTDQLLDEVGNATEFDVVKELAAPLPILTIAELLGIPVEDHKRFQEWSLILVSSPSDDNPLNIQSALMEKKRVIEELFIYFLSIIEKRRKTPNDGVISILMSDNDLSVEDIVNFCIVLLFAGSETTTHLITNSLFCILTEEHLLNELVTTESKIPLAIEEVLRYRSPVQAMNRIVSADTTLRGKLLRKGDYVVVWIGSANRDPLQFYNSNQFILNRKPNQHLAFSKGENFCLGAPLARLEAKVAIAEILKRYPHLNLKDTYKTKPLKSPFVYGLEELIIRTTKEQENVFYLY